MLVQISRNRLPSLLLMPSVRHHNLEIFSCAMFIWLSTGPADPKTFFPIFWNHHNRVHFELARCDFGYHYHYYWHDEKSYTVTHSENRPSAGKRNLESQRKKSFCETKSSKYCFGDHLKPIINTQVEHPQQYSRWGGW